MSASLGRSPFILLCAMHAHDVCGSLPCCRCDCCAVRCHYTGRLASNNRVFDSSYERGRPLTFKVGPSAVHVCPAAMKSTSQTLYMHAMHACQLLWHLLVLQSSTGKRQGQRI
jgi:hypothetical protein